MKQKLLPLCVALLALVLCNTPLFAEDFEVDGICYNITSEEDLTVEVTDRYYYDAPYSGSITIPKSVVYNENTYTVTSIGHGAFSYCSDLTNVIIPNSITTIGQYAFEFCASLTDITIPNSITSIGYNAFLYCESIAEINIPNSVTTIEGCAFQGCSSLTSITIPSSTTTIGYAAFSECSNLTEITVAEDNPTFDSRDNCNAIIETETNTLIAGCCKTIIPNTVTTIAKEAFSFNQILTEINIPSSVTTIENAAFAGCISLTKITVAEDNPIYDSRDNCNAIIETETNTLIAGCSKTIIPNTVTTIGESAFVLCINLTEIALPSSVMTIADAAFAGCISLTKITVAEDNPIYDSRDNCDAIIETETNTLIAGCSKTIIPNTVTTIGESAFGLCINLTKITIPNGVTTIREDAFAMCLSLKEITIPNSVTAIGNWAFIDCDSLATATVGCSWITNPLYEFDENVTVNATLHSYENGVCTVCGEEETTGIDGITSNVHQRSEIFDLQGRRVNNAGKGLYIVNGKKVLVK